MIILRNICKIYKSGKINTIALDNINITLKNGEFISVIGQSGSGKSTLLNIIGLLDNPTSGDVYINNELIKNKRDSKLTRYRNMHIGFVFQSFNLIPVLSVKENIELPLFFNNIIKKNKHISEWSDYLIEAVGLYEYKKRRPIELSSGQQQRVAIARALVCKPTLVLADEPTANLDSSTGIQIIKLLRKINYEYNTTFILSTHDKDIVDITDHVVELKDGRIVNNMIKDK